MKFEKRAVVAINLPGQPIDGACVMMASQSKRTGGISVEFLYGRGAYKIGDELQLAPHELRAAVSCQWFANCENPANGTMPHPVLGEVPICERCRKRAE